MKLAGRIWLIRLTTLGNRALEDVIKVTQKGTFEAQVIDEDEHGIWLSPIEDEAGMRPGLTILLKWEYVATMQVVE